ncbi:hypothetical protein Tco_0697474 [Tanacetum coccineum]
MKMVPYEAFACGCGAGDVVLRESYKPKTHASGKLLWMWIFLWKEERVRLLTSSPRASSTLRYSPRTSTPPSYSLGSSTPQSYSPRSSKNAECSNCKHLLDKITVLKATVEMYMHPEQHTVNSAALLHEIYNDIGKLDLEYLGKIALDVDFLWKEKRVRLLTSSLEASSTLHVILRGLHHLQAFIQDLNPQARSSRIFKKCRKCSNLQALA